MRPASSAFLEAVAQQQTLSTRAVLFDPRGGSQEIEITDGSVTLDATSAIRGSAELTVVLADLVPASAGDPLTPYGSEIQIWRGLTLPDLSEELMSLGRFGLNDVDVSDAGDSLEIRLTLYDRAKEISEDTFEEPYQVPAGSLFTEAILDVVRRTFPDVVHSGFENPDGSPTISYLTPIVLATEEQTDPWEFAQLMAMSIGCDLYHDGDGVLVLRSAGDLTVQATVAEGENGVLVRVAKKWTREGVHNRWIVTGESSGETTVRGVATDDDPSSPTYYYGPFRRKPRFETLEYIDTLDVDHARQQVQEVAEMLKARELGKTQALDFGSIVNPALEPDDVVRVTREQSKIDEDHVLDQVVIPLGPDQEMTALTRAIQVLA